MNRCDLIETERTGMRVTIPILLKLQAKLDNGPTDDLSFVAAARFVSRQMQISSGPY